MIKVAYILHATEASAGSTKAVCAMMDGLRAYGVQPVAVVPDKKGIYADLQERGIPVLAVPFRAPVLSFCMNWLDVLLFVPRMIAKAIANPLAVRRVAAFLKEQQVDVVHSNVSVIDIGERAARSIKKPHIYHIREYGDQIFRFIPSNQAYRNKLQAGRQYTICITRDLQQYFHLQDKATSAVIYDGVMHQETSMPSSPQKNYYLFVGRLEEQKGLDFLIEGYQSYHQQTAHPMPLKIAGAATDLVVEARVRRYVQEHGLQDSVEFMGQVSNVATLMQEAKAVIISSSAEGFGFVMVEAMFNGCLCIGRNMSGTKEQMDNGLQFTGDEIALRCNTEEQLTQRLLDVDEHGSDAYLPLRQQAFNTVNKLYSIETNVKQIYDFYVNVVRKEAVNDEK